MIGRVSAQVAASHGAGERDQEIVGQEVVKGELRTGEGHPGLFDTLAGDGVVNGELHGMRWMTPKWVVEKLTLHMGFQTQI